jgi:formate hydrogenlyase transcriptional activator
MLVTYFVSRFAKKFGRKIDGVTRDTMDRLTHYQWPGNIRELQNIVERAVVMAQGSLLTLDADVLPMTHAGESQKQQEAHEPPPHAGTLSLNEAERRHIETVLNQTGGVIEGPAGAAKILNLHPNTLRSRMKKLGVQRPAAHEVS